VLKYVQQNPTTSVMKEKLTKAGLRLLITFIKIDSVEIALKRLKKVLGHF
jgi:transcription-repair coupling factor (superfamily II helicase)